MNLSSQQIALWADQLRDIAAYGLHFSDSVYDRERYHSIQKVALSMLAAATGEPEASFEPLVAPVFLHFTPFATGDAAVINELGEILLIRRADNHCWAMPGGALEVGETPAEGAAREALEESGVQCEPVAMVGVFDSRYCGSTTRHHLYHFVFLCRPLAIFPPAQATHAHEVVEVGWFAEHALPDEIDPGHVSRIPAAYRVWRGDPLPYFDR